MLVNSSKINDSTHKTNPVSSLNCVTNYHIENSYECMDSIWGKTLYTTYRGFFFVFLDYMGMFSEYFYFLRNL